MAVPEAAADVACRCRVSGYNISTVPRAAAQMLPLSTAGTLELGVAAASAASSIATSICGLHGELPPLLHVPGG